MHVSALQPFRTGQGGLLQVTEWKVIPEASKFSASSSHQSYFGETDISRGWAVEDPCKYYCWLFYFAKFQSPRFGFFSRRVNWHKTSTNGCALMSSTHVSNQNWIGDLQAWLHDVDTCSHPTLFGKLFEFSLAPRFKGTMVGFGRILVNCYAIVGVCFMINNISSWNSPLSTSLRSCTHYQQIC